MTTRRTRPSTVYVGTEDNFQRSAIQHVRTLCSARGIDPRRVIHIPLETATNRKTVFSRKAGRMISISTAGKRMKEQGAVSGYPDIMVFAPAIVEGVFNYGLGIELKVWPRKPEPHQLEIADLLRLAGWSVHLAYSLDHVSEITKEYLRGRRSLESLHTDVSIAKINVSLP